jgi:hypothetical protein
MAPISKKKKKKGKEKERMIVFGIHSRWKSNTAVLLWKISVF